MSRKPFPRQRTQKRKVRCSRCLELVVWEPRAQSYNHRYLGRARHPNIAGARKFDDTASTALSFDIFEICLSIYVPYYKGSSRASYKYYPKE